MKSPDRKNSVQSLDRAFDIIEALGLSRGGMSISKLCQATGLHKSTVHRLLSAMKSRGYVLQEENAAYRLTFKVCELANRVIDGVSLVNVAKPHVKRMSDLSRETTHLVCREGNNTVYLIREECLETVVRVVSNFGMHRPMHVSAVGKSIMAAMSDDEIARYWREVEAKPITPHTICDLDALLADIAQTRLRGYAVDNEENTLGVRCMAVALGDYLGRSLAAISITGPKERMSDARMDELTPIIYRTRDAIMAGMGYSAPSTR